MRPFLHAMCNVQISGSHNWPFQFASCDTFGRAGGRTKEIHETDGFLGALCAKAGSPSTPYGLWVFRSSITAF